MPGVTGAACQPRLWHSLYMAVSALGNRCGKNIFLARAPLTAVHNKYVIRNKYHDHEYLAIPITTVNISTQTNPMKNKENARCGHTREHRSRNVDNSYYYSSLS